VSHDVVAAAQPRSAASDRTTLAPLLAAALALSQEHDTDRLLDRVVASAAELTDSRYAALAVYGSDGAIRRFVHVGVTPQTAAAIGHPPLGRGLLHELALGSGPIRLDDVAADHRFAGFPPGHPQMHSFLGVPIIVGGRRFGNLYAADKRSGRFGSDDEVALAALAAFAAAALDSAELLAAERARAEAVADAAAARERERLRTEMLARVIDAQESERARVARDLHDEIGQALTSVLLGLHLVDSAVTADPVDAAGAAERTAEVRLLVADALRQARQLAFELRPTVLDDIGLVAALRRLTTDLGNRHGLQIHLRLTGFADDLRLPPAVETVAYRVAQESLTNVLRHARASSVTVDAEIVEGHLRLSVRDDGVGFVPADVTSSLGLSGMAERAELAGGSLRVVSSPGSGCTVDLELPRG